MNISNVYEVEIWMVLNNDYCNYIYKSKFIKKTIVYKGKYSDYYDLSTKQRYAVGSVLCARGDMFINQETMIPVSSIIDTKRKYV